MPRGCRDFSLSVSNWSPSLINRSFTRPSASTTEGLTWIACPPPAPAWTCSSSPSSATSTWWGTSCCMPSSHPPGSSWAELCLQTWTPQKWLWGERLKIDEGKQTMHWLILLFVCVRACVPSRWWGNAPPQTERRVLLNHLKCWIPSYSSDRSAA